MSNDANRTLGSEGEDFRAPKPRQTLKPWTTPTVIVGSATDDTEHGGGGATDTHVVS